MTLDFNIHTIGYVEQGGGSITPSGTKAINENGVYDVTTYAKASVNVESTEPTLVTKTIVANGTYSAEDDNADGYSSVSVNVPSTEPTGTYTITANGTYDIASYANADVNVSGGGGSSVKDIVDEAVYELPANTDSISVYNNYPDWTVKPYYRTNSYGIANNYGGLIGVVFNEFAPDIIYTTAEVFKVPTGSTVEVVQNEGAYNEVVKITFPSNSDKYIIYCEHYAFRLGFDDNAISESYGAYSLGGGRKTIFNYVKYLNTRFLSTDYTAQSPRITSLDGSYYIMPVLTVLEDLKISDNMRFSIPSTLNASGVCYTYPQSPNYSAKTFFDNYVTNASYGVTALSASESAKIFTDTGGYWAKILCAGGEFPYVLDCSSFPNSGTFYVPSAQYNAYSYRMSTNLHEVFLKLPTIMNLDFTIQGANTMSLTLNTLQYMAQNSPSVSSKTMRLGDLKNLANNNDVTIIQTLTNKGWTIN